MSPNSYNPFVADEAQEVEWIDPPELPQKANGPLELSSAIDMLAQIEEDAGFEFSAAKRARLLKQMQKGDFEARIPVNPFVAEDAEEETPELFTPVSTAEEPSISGFLKESARDILRFHDTANKAARGTVLQAAGQALSFDAEESAVPVVARTADLVTNPIGHILSSDEGKRKNAQALADRVVAMGEDNQRAVQEYREEQSIGEGFDGGARGIALDLAANPDMALTQLSSVLGPEVSGWLATVPAGRVFLNDYYAQRKEGVPKDEAKAHALAQAGIEWAMEIIPGGKTAKLTRLGEAAVVASAKKRVAKSALGEGVQESATETAQGGLDTAITELDIGSDELQAASEKQDFDVDTAEGLQAMGERIAYAGAIGSIAGGGMRSTTAHLEVAAEMGAQRAANPKRSLENSFKHLTEAATEREIQVQQQAAAQQQADEAEATKRTIQRQQAADTYAQNTGTRVASVKPVTAQEIKAEREQAAQAEAERLQRVELGRQAEQLRKEQELTPKPKRKKKTKVAEGTSIADPLRKQQIGRIQATRKELGLDDATYRSLLSKVTGKTSSKDMTLEQREAVLAAMAEVKAGKAPADVTTAPVAAPVPTKTDRELEDADTRKLAEQAGIKVAKVNETLGMKGKPKIKVPGDFVPKVQAIFNNLIKRNTQQTADVQNIILQDKLVLVPNAASVNRPDLGNRAEYDTETGKMYVYTDSMDPDDIVSNMIEAMAGHESTHAGQDSGREGRSVVLSELMSKEENNRINTKIKEQAVKDRKAGKKTAYTQAVDQAIAAAEGDKNVETLEVAGYFVSEVLERRNNNGIIGNARTTVQDIRAAVRGAVREKLGIDLDITLDEIEAATTKVVGEIAATDIKPPKSKDGMGSTLGMIGGKSGRGYEDALKQNKLYPGSVDKLMRYEFSDGKSEILNDGLARILIGESVKLDEILKHDELYKNYPRSANDLSVEVDKTLPEDVIGRFSRGRFYLNPKFLTAGGKDNIRKTLLHEVQHYIQEREGFVPGTAPHYFMPFNITAGLRTATRKADEAAARFDLDEAIKDIPPASRERWERYAERKKSEFLLGKLDRTKEFIDNGYAYGVKNPMLVRQLNDFVEADRLRGVAQNSYDQAYEKAQALYEKDYGEAEARNTEYRADLTDAEREAMPPEATMVLADRNINVEDTIDTRTVRGVKGQAASTLGMAAREKQQSPKEALSTKETLRRILDHGVRTQTADIKFAEDLDTKYRRAIAIDMKDRTDLDAINEEIMSKLTAVDNADGAARKVLWANFKKKYPNLAPVLETMRDTIDASTKEYISTLLNSGRILSKKENKDIRTLLANQGKYLTRAYSAFQQKVGRPWAENRWNDYKTKLKSYATIPPGLSRRARRKAEQVKRNVEAVLDAIKFIESQIVIPDNDKLIAMKTDKLEQLYDLHLGTVNRLDYKQNANDPLAARRAALVEALADRRDSLPPGHYNIAAEQTVKELLGLDEKTSTYSRVFSDLAKDPGTLKKKEHIPDEIRNLLGEITNPGGVVLATLSSQAALNARARVIFELLTKENGNLVIPASRINEPGMREKFPVPLTGQQYGQLEGFYATKNTAAALTDTLDAYHTYGEALARFRQQPGILFEKAAKDVLKKGVAKITRAEKIIGVVMKPYNWAGNVLGSPINMLRSGNFSPSTAVKGLKTGRDYIYGTAGNTTTDLLEDAIRYVNIEAVDVAEMQRVLGDKIGNYMDGQITAENVEDFIKDKIPAGKVARRAGRTVVASYAMLDAWVKVANFYERVNTLSRYYKLTGADITPEEIKREAGDVTSYTNLSNERVPNWLKLPEQHGVTKFIPYFSETLRTTWTNYAQGLLDLKRAAETKNTEAAAVMRSAAARRLIGNTLSTVALPLRFPLLTNVALGAFGISAFALAGDDDDAEKKRRMLSEFNRHQDMIQFGVDKEGKPIYLPVSMRLDPNGPATDIFRIFANTETNKETFDAVTRYLKDLVITPTWIAHTYASATRDTVPESKVAANFPDATNAAGDLVSNVGVERVTVNKALYNIESLIPGLSILGIPKYKAQLDEKAPMGQVAAINSLEALGASFETLEPSRALRGFGMEAEDAKRSNRAKLADNILLRSEIDDDSVLDAITKYRVKERDRYLIGRQSYESLKAWQYDDREIGPMLVEAGWSKREVADIVAGDDTSILSIRSLSDSKRGKEDEDKLKQVLDIINKNKAQLEEIGIEVRKD